MRNVFRIYVQFLLVIVLLAGNSCQRNTSDPLPNPPVDPLEEKVTASLRGRVVDENGKPILQGDAIVPSDRMLMINYSRMPFLFDYPSPVSTSIMTREGSAVLWRRWRLLGTTELYNLAEDPMQERNVIDNYPDIAEKMTKHLDGWWEGVAHTRNALQSIPLGNDNGEVMLTACEWVDVFVDQQVQILKGVRKNGYWNIEFLQ